MSEKEIAIKHYANLVNALATKVNIRPYTLCPNESYEENMARLFWIYVDSNGKSNKEVTEAKLKAEKFEDKDAPISWGARHG
jgi:hypothetical protein